MLRDQALCSVPETRTDIFAILNADAYMSVVWLQDRQEAVQDMAWRQGMEVNNARDETEDITEQYWELHDRMQEKQREMEALQAELETARSQAAGLQVHAALVKLCLPDSKENRLSWCLRLIPMGKVVALCKSLKHEHSLEHVQQIWGQSSTAQSQGDPCPYISMLQCSDTRHLLLDNNMVISMGHLLNHIGFL